MISIKRRTISWVLGFICCFCLIGVSLAAALDTDRPQKRVRFQDVVARAKVLAKKSFEDPAGTLPDVFKKMGYDQWRDIRFNPTRSLWLTQPYSVQFFHPGFLYQHPVIIHYVDQRGTHQFPFSADLFNYGSHVHQGDLSGDYGFAGFRIHYPLNTPKYADELVAFLGASYFRALGRDLTYGISARGLAINTAEDSDEEFPFFREFWIVHPTLRAKGIIVYALLDSPSVTGAYEFTVEPGEATRLKVKSVIFIRQHIQRIGIAPLNSMFFYGKNTGVVRDNDFRPEVHDSDGLEMTLKSGEWIWHPLVNPPRLLVNAFGGGLPLGFGLLQRDIDFDHYQDLEARYDRRPSVWVSPKGDWGEGHLELVQIPTDSEYNDNIVAYWVPQRAFERGDSVKYDYTLDWYSAAHQRCAQGIVQATRIMKKPDGLMFFIEFAGDAFKTAALKDIVPVPDIWIGQGGHLTDSQLIRNTVTGGWRLVLHVALDAPKTIGLGLPNQKPAVEFRAFLKDKGSAVTETWSYTYLQ